MECLIQGDEFSREKLYCPRLKPLKNFLLVVSDQRMLSCKHKVSESMATEIKSNPRYLNYGEVNLLATLGTRGFFFFARGEELTSAGADYPDVGQRPKVLAVRRKNL